MNRDTVWHELYDRMTGYVCPVCDLINVRNRSSIESIIYIDLLSDVIKDISVKQKGKCLFCESVKHGEAIYEKHFAECFDDKEFRDKYRKNGILCVAHYQKISSHLRNSENAEKLRIATQERYHKLLHELEEIKRKNDYRYSGEEWDPETKTAWQRAVAIINGYPGMNK